jgi:hypothetical protein
MGETCGQVELSSEADSINPDDSISVASSNKSQKRKKYEDPSLADSMYSLFSFQEKLFDFESRKEELATIRHVELLMQQSRLADLKAEMIQVGFRI